MSDPEDRDSIESLGLSDKDRKMIEDALDAAKLESSDPSKPIDSEEKAEYTFQQIHRHFSDLLSEVEKSVRSSEAAINENLENTVLALTNELQTIGLGVFATRAGAVVKKRLNENLSGIKQLEEVTMTLNSVKEELDNMVFTTSNGITMQVFQTAESHSNQLIQLYAKLNELDKLLESTRAEVKLWRSKASEQEELVKMKEESLKQSQKNIDDLRASLSDLRMSIEQKDGEIADLKGKLEASQVQLGTQKDLLSQLGSSEVIAKEYETRIEELANIRGQIMVYEDKLMQRDAAIDLLKKEVRDLEQQKDELEKQIENMKYHSAEFIGAKESQSAEIERLKSEIAEMQTRWDALYQIAEDEPAFKAYFIIAGKTNWLPLQHLSSALGIPTILLKRRLQKFLDAGLIEIEDDKIRPRTLSEANKEKSISETSDSASTTEDKDFDN